MHTEAELRWLDMVEARLDDIREQPIPLPAPRPRGRPRKAVRQDRSNPYYRINSVCYRL